MVSVEAVQSRGKDDSENGELGYEWKGLHNKTSHVQLPEIKSDVRQSALESLVSLPLLQHNG